MNNSRNESANLNFLDQLNVDVKVKEKLSTLLSRTITGNDEVYMTPIAKEHGSEVLFSEFNKVFDTNKSKLNETLQNLESLNKRSFGPRSIAIPWSDRKQSLIDSFSKEKRFTTNGLDIKVNNNRQVLRPLSKEQALLLLKNDTSSGLPYLAKKGILKERVSDNFESLLSRRDPCVLFTRTQERGKTRNVWGYPMADTLFEMMYYAPLLAHQKKLPYRSAIVSPEEVSRRMTEIILRSVNSGYKLISVDFERYDNTAKSKVQRYAFNYIKSLFQSQFHDDIDKIADRFRTISILTPDGVMSGDHGIPSGSTFTNEVGSIIQSIIVTSLGTVLDYLVQGDDGVYLIPEDKVDEVRLVFQSFGMIVNEDKSYVSDNYAIYLQNLYHIDYLNNGVIGGIYPVYRALNRILFQERWSDFEDYEITGKDYYSIRTICIVENCKYHPLFKELVKFVMKYDKYSLVVSDQGISNYVQMVRRTKGAGEILNHQYGDNVSGIRSFETFKMINELS